MKDTLVIKSSVGSATEKNSDSSMQQLHIWPQAKLQLCTSASTTALESLYLKGIVKIHSLMLIGRYHTSKKLYQNSCDNSSGNGDI